MSDFIPYQHIERFGTTEVQDIEAGTCYVFPKIDGTNSSVWLDNENKLHAGSRNRELSLGKDNAGFFASALEDAQILEYLQKFPSHRLYGEWLVPHSLKTYRDTAWRKFYVFDVMEGTEYLSYAEYVPQLEEFGINYVPLLAEVRNGSKEQFIDLLDKNQFLIQDGKGAGEGIVIKNYAFRNKYGRVTWAKMVRSEFRDLHSKTMGAPVIQGERRVEQDIVDRYCTNALIEKEYAKIAIEGWSSKKIPQLLGIVFHCLITEEAWNMVKEFKYPTVDFKKLNNLTIAKIKQEKPEIFR